MNNVLGIFSTSVLGSLIAVVHIDSETLYGSLKFLLEMLCVGLTAAKGVGSVNVGLTNIFIEAFGNCGNVYGNLSKAVKLVPGEEKTCLFTHFAKGLNYKIARSYIAEVSDMNRARGGDTCGADVFRLIGVSFDNFLCDFF